MKYIFCILLGLLPSLIWLSFYLRKDKNPEPNKMILKVFFFGMLITPIAIVLELALIWLLEPTYNPLNILSKISQASLIKFTIAATLIPALVEEYLKYAVVKFKVIKKSVFDEPTDAMIYCIIAGLGFAAIENLLVLFNINFPNFEQAIGTMIFRFLGATFVHALSSGIVGYYLALGLLNTSKRKKLISYGLGIAIIFHSCYNYLVINTFDQTDNRFLFISIIAILLISAALIISYCFKKLKQKQSICKLKNIADYE